jgi:replication factor C large subunit
MLYAASIGTETTITTQTSRKDKRATPFDLVSAPFEAGDPRPLLQISFEMDETPDVALLWLEENLSLVTDPNAQSECYHMLTRADQFLGRTLKTQYYTLWRYATACMLFGVNAGAHGRVVRAKLNPPSRLKKIGTAKRKRLIRQSLYHTIGSALHMAQTTVRADYLRPVSVLSQQNPEKCAEILTDDLDQLSILLEDPAQAKAIVKTLEKERKEAEKAQKKKTSASVSPSKKQPSEKKNASTESEAPESHLETFSNAQPVHQPQEHSHGEGSKDKEKGEKREESDAKDNAQATLFSFG